MLPHLQNIINKAKAHNPSVTIIQIRIIDSGDNYKVQELLFNSDIYWPGENTPNFTAKNAKFLYVCLGYRPICIKHSSSASPARSSRYYNITSTDILQNAILKRIH